ncbi:MAG: hypothetical protein FJ276_03755 [Planctomycetes bacterium]|nr:hypothetical protein [Planctomycetota bacterium]
MIRSKGTRSPEAANTSRRRFVGVAGAGLATALGGSLCQGADQEATSSRVLKPGDKIDVGGKGKEIIQRAYELGFQYEKQHGG